VNKRPAEVRVWFSEPLQVSASSIQVFDIRGKQMDKHDTHSDRNNPAILCVSLIPRLAAGTYKVTWRVTSMDTHVTDGNFYFQIIQ
jgi:methionine-rich copper-binding protein CopC